MNKEVDLSVSCYGKVKDRKYDIVSKLPKLAY